jgi:hypothetical protein
VAALVLWLERQAEIRLLSVPVVEGPSELIVELLIGEA